MELGQPGKEEGRVGKGRGAKRSTVTVVHPFEPTH